MWAEEIFFWYCGNNGDFFWKKREKSIWRVGYCDRKKEKMQLPDCTYNSSINMINVYCTDVRYMNDVQVNDVGNNRNNDVDDGDGGG